MRRLLDGLEKARPHFLKGGALERLAPLYEAADTFLFSPPETAPRAPHVRDAMDLKRLMSIVVAALLPCVAMGFYNTGLQSLASRGLETRPLWCVWTGAQAVLPLIAVSYAVGGFWELLFAAARRHELNEGFLVTGILFPLTLAPTTPLWMAALGITFGVVIGKEVFGGTGMNILNPALTARAFVFFAYPAAISGDGVWTYLAPDAVSSATMGAVDGFTGATPLLVAAGHAGPGAEAAVAKAGFHFHELLLGTVPGSIGETSALACLFGAAVLVATGVGSWRIIASCVLGGAAASGLVGALAGPDSGGLAHLPYAWHLVMGGFAFGTAFMATDPVSGAATPGGQWVYGGLIGFLAILIRAVNPAYPEGMMLSILFMNVFAPLIDHVFKQRHFRSRLPGRGA